MTTATPLRSLMQQSRTSQHDAMVSRAANILLVTGVPNVTADAPGFQRPTKIVWSATQEGHIPDVMTKTHIYEVETVDSLSSEHTKSQCQLFGQFAREWGYTFVVIVPKGSEQMMKLWLFHWNVQAAVTGM